MKIIWPILLLGFVVLTTFISCRENEAQQYVKVNFSKKSEFRNNTEEFSAPLRASVSAMISPEENFIYFNGIFEYIAAKVGRSLKFVQRNSYNEVIDLLQSREIDIAFLCSGAYIEANKIFNAEIIAIPEVDGKSTYKSYLVVLDDSGLKNINGLKGKKVAFTDPLSNTGCLYPSYLLTKMGLRPKDFFQDILYTYAHDNSIQAVKRQLVDGAYVDSLVFDQLKKNNPSRVSGLIIIDRSPPFGIPPIVMHPDMDPNLKRKIQETMLYMDLNRKGKELLSFAGIDRFVIGRDKDYDSIREMKLNLYLPGK